MKKFTTAILLLDLVVGLLFFGLWEEKYAGKAMETVGMGRGERGGNSGVFAGGRGMVVQQSDG